jgi:cytochrome c556
MRNWIWIVPAAAAVLGACAATVDNRTVAAPEALPPQQIVAARQASFHMSGAAMGNMRALIERDGDPKSQAYAARGVARWAEVLPTMFPQSTAGIGPSRAKAEIWSNKADFNAKAAAFAAAARRLAEVAATGDKAAFAAQHSATGATCGACHELYQVPQQPGG